VKNNIPKNVASDAKVRKSYRSRKVPTQAAVMTLRWMVAGWGVERLEGKINS